MSATTTSPAKSQDPSSTSAGSPVPARAARAERRASRTRKPVDPAVAARKARRRNNIPAEPNAAEPIPKRILRSPMVWLTVVMLLAYATLLVLLYRQVVPDQEVPGGTIPGLGTEAVPIAAKYAAITAIPLSLLFLWADRYRPQRFWVWVMTFGWGACVATFVSAQVNTWAASQLSIIGDGDPATGARAAIFVAPWVEEAAKATVLFWLAILMRYQWVGRVSGIVLAGLSGAAFAFVENILYYGRAYRYAARSFGEVPPLEALQSLFMLRGVMTFFGHPLFTAMTGIGLAVALRAKSKIVRVVAPLAGYTAAVFLHMAFNASASLLQGTNLLLIYLLVAIPLVIGVAIFTVRQILHEGRLIRSRLVDYVRLGWLPEGDPAALSRLRIRGRALWHAVFLGPDALLATVRMQRSATELAYLRDAMARGIVDGGGLEREKLLLHKVYELRPVAVVQPTGRAAYPSFRRRRPVESTPSYAPASFPGPAGLGGNYPAPPPQTRAPAPLGQTATQYSEVDPTWKPPGQ
jgi:RsiW-degrading membrane proteinase PrsW (M82 family)